MARTRKGSRPGYTLAPETAQHFPSRLLAWFYAHKRDLPWRRQRNPYEIWVSEIMLQQTRVDTVIPYWQRWMQLFPTVGHLAQAEEEQVLKAWEGLGYYSRARNLYLAARKVVREHGGAMPLDPAAVRALPGVGSYTAGAICSIAYDLPEPAVDGNVLRVLTRIGAIHDDIAAPATKEQMEALVRTLIPPKAGDFNQALMELGALICTPASPKCLACPVAELCAAHADGLQAELPVKAKAKAPRPVELVAAVLWHEGRILVEQRPAEGLLANLWQFPQGERLADEPWHDTLHRVARAAYGLQVLPAGPGVPVQHTFSHLQWQVMAFPCTLERFSPATPAPAATERRWVTLAELSALPMATAHQRIRRALAVEFTKEASLS